jgi:hypothetical protein
MISGVFLGFFGTKKSCRIFCVCTIVGGFRRFIEKILCDFVLEKLPFSKIPFTFVLQFEVAVGYRHFAVLMNAFMPNKVKSLILILFQVISCFMQAQRYDCVAETMPFSLHYASGDIKS